MDKSNNIERRYITQPIELRAEEGDAPSRHVTGYAALFDSDSVEMAYDFDGSSFTEQIAPGAFDGIVERSDVLALLNHDESRGVLARSTHGAGSLALSVDDRGLRYEFDAPATALGDELLEGLRRGDITASSFAFTVKGEAWEQVGDKTYKRTITKVGDLYDVSPVYRPAYPDTSVAQRSLGVAIEERDHVAEVVAEQEEDDTNDCNTTNYNTFTL